MTMTVHRVDTRRIADPWLDGKRAYSIACDGCDRPSKLFVGNEPTPEEIAEYERAHHCRGERLTWKPGADA